MNDNNEVKKYQQLNISVAIFLLYNLDKDLSDIWKQKWKFSKNWENDFIEKLNKIPQDTIEEKYNEFLDIFSGDGSVVFDTKRNRFTDYGSKNDDIKKVKEGYFLKEDLRIKEYNEKNNKNIKNNKKINALIYPVDLAFFDIKVDDYGMEFDLAENILFDNKMFSFLDKVKECENIKNLKNVSIIKSSDKTIEQEDKKFIEYYNDNKNISFSEYKSRFLKSYFFKKNGLEALNSLYEANVILTKDGSSIIPMSNINTFTSFNPENINSYQNIKNTGNGTFFKLFSGSSSGCFIKFNKQKNDQQIKRVYIGEGVATCLSAQKLIDNSSDFICAFNADNLVKVTKELYEKYKDKVEIVVCVDKDKQRVKYEKVNDFFPKEFSIGKGFSVLENLINEIGENNLKFACPEFIKNIDNTTIELKLSDDYRKLCYSKGFDRSDFNDSNLNLENSKNNLINPQILNYDNFNNLKFNLLIDEHEIKEFKISELKDNSIKESLNKIYFSNLIEVLKNENIKKEFIDTFGNEGLNKIINFGLKFNIDVIEIQKPIFLNNEKEEKEIEC